MGVKAFQIVISSMMASSLICHVWLGRPENKKTPPMHFRFPLYDFDVTMLNNHKSAKICVNASVCCSGTRNKSPTVVKVCYSCSTRLVRPVSVSPLSVPVVIPPWSNNQCDQVAILGARIPRGRAIDEIVFYCC